MEGFESCLAKSGIFFCQRGWLSPGTGSPGSTKPDRVQGAFGQYSQGHGVTLGVFCAGPGIVLNDSDGSPPTENIIWIYDFKIWILTAVEKQ